MAITSLSVTVAESQQWTASNTITGLSAPTVNSGKNNKQQTYVNTIANAALGGADQYFNFLLTIAASGNSLLDLTAMTNILQQAAVSIARIKAYQFQLLSVTDDAVNGTACSSITIGNAGSNAQLLNLGGTTPTFNVNNGGSWSYCDQTAGGFTVDGTHKILKFLNNDGALAAAILVQIVAGST